MRCAPRQHELAELTVVTLTYNNWRDLLATIQSVNLAQDTLSIHHVVINGGSCTHTRKQLSRINDVISVSEPDDGIADAFNKGLSLATTPYVTFLNSGDRLLSPQHYRTAVDRLNSESGPRVAGGSIITSTPSGRPRLVSANLRRPIGYGMPIPHPSMIYSRCVFQVVGTFDTSFKIAMDYEHLCRMRKANIPIFINNDCPSVLMSAPGASANYPAALRENARAIRVHANTPVNWSCFYYLWMKATLKQAVARLANTIASTTPAAFGT